MSVTDADIIAEHLAHCTSAQAAIVVDGPADDIITQLTRAGWVLEDRVDVISGKRIRFMRVP
jgi:hypothetical protein